MTELQKSERLDLSRAAVERQIAGALRSCIQAHGPITADRIGSATKRAAHQLRSYGLWRELARLYGSDDG